MNEKLKKISLKLSKRYKYSDLNDVYTKFLKDVSNNKEYFSLYDPRDYVKMVLYIHSLLETGGFEWGDGMIKNSFVGNYFEFGEDDFAEEECENCGGEGYVNCDTCDGTGQVDCDDCNGNGQVNCEACDGSGEDDEGDECSDCRGNGEVDCEECDSSGKVTCGDCRGDSTYSCDDCNGRGYVQSDELKYYNTTFITWDKDLINVFRNSMELQKPTSINDFLPFRNEDKMLVLITEEDQEEFRTDVKPDKFYCFTLSPLEETDLFIKNKPTGITTHDEPNDYTY